MWFETIIAAVLLLLSEVNGASISSLIQDEPIYSAQFYSRLNNPNILQSPSSNVESEDVAPGITVPVIPSSFEQSPSNSAEAENVAPAISVSASSSSSMLQSPSSYADAEVLPVTTEPVTPSPIPQSPSNSAEAENVAPGISVPAISSSSLILQSSSNNAEEENVAPEISVPAIPASILESPPNSAESENVEISDPVVPSSNLPSSLNSAEAESVPDGVPPPATSRVILQSVSSNVETENVEPTFSDPLKSSIPQSASSNVETENVDSMISAPVESSVVHSASGNVNAENEDSIISGPIVSLSNLESASSYAEAENVAPTISTLVISSPQQNTNSMLHFLSPSDTDAEVSALVRRHGDIKLDDNGSRVQNGPLKKVHTKVMSTESFDEGYCHIKQKGPLIRLFGGSKFFADSDRMYTYEQAKDVCRENGLELAELEEIQDHRSMENFLKQFLVVDNTCKKFYVGTNDIEEEGNFVHGNGKALTFQNFLSSEPDDKDQNEDCVVIMQDGIGGPVGSADVACNRTANVLCMFPSASECYKESKEAEENFKLIKNRELISIVNVTGMNSYYVSNFQLNWNKAMRYCNDRNMTLFSMDKTVTMIFFQALASWEKNWTQAKYPTPFQFWTSGRFQATHMSAPIFFATKPMDKSSSEEGFDFDGEGQSPHHFLNASFVFSGVYVWSTKKGKDPGGPYNNRRDLCLSFSFEKGDGTPVVRNTNCELPQYFLCAQEYSGLEKEDY